MAWSESVRLNGTEIEYPIGHLPLVKWARRIGLDADKVRSGSVRIIGPLVFATYIEGQGRVFRPVIRFYFAKLPEVPDA